MGVAAAYGIFAQPMGCSRLGVAAAYGNIVTHRLLQPDCQSPWDRRSPTVCNGARRLRPPDACPPTLA